VIKLAYALKSEPELEAFFSAFFNFVEALSLTDSDAVSVSTGPSGHPWDRVVTFGNETEAQEFRDYWAQRKNGWDLKTLHRNLPLPIRLWTYEKALRLLSLALPLAIPDNIRSGPVHLSGFFNQGFGIGRAGDLTNLGLKSLNIQHKTHGLRLNNHSEIEPPNPNGVWIIHANAPEALMALIKTPRQLWQNKKLIGYWAWETPIMPEFWAYCARFFHEIWLPSHYCLKAAETALMAQRGPRPTLRRVPHPVSLWRHEEDIRPNFEALKVLILFDLDSSIVRKNPQAALKAYLMAFEQPQTNVSLTLKITGGQNASQSITNLMKLIQGRPDISVILDPIPQSMMRRFFASHNVLLSLHRSEGFGLSLAEAMDLGLCVIATKGSGACDYFNTSTGFVVPAHLVAIEDPSGPYAFAKNQSWFEADIDQASAHLKSLALSPELRQTKAKCARDIVDQLTEDFHDQVSRALKT